MDFKILNKTVYAVARITPQGLKILGTCFNVNKPGLFATSLHVTDQDERGLVIISWATSGLDSYQSVPENVNYGEVKIVAGDPVSDVCLLRLEGNQETNFRINGADFTRVTDKVNVVGYPHATENRLVLTVQSCTVGAKVNLPVSGIDVKHLVLNLQTRPGQSGSPVFRDDNQSLIGIISGAYTSPSMIEIPGVNPGSLNQTTYAVSSEYLLAML